MRAFIADLLSLELVANAARKLAVRRLGLAAIPCLLETLTCLQQVRRQIGPTDLHAKALDQATAGCDGPAGLPEGATLARARLGSPSGQVKCAIRSDLAHDCSLGR